jgi:FMNH2-dependent dimethyl sulfone monooxygenase
MAEAAEQSGLDSVWLADHFLYKAPDGTTYGMHEAWTLLSAVAAVTNRVELGTMVLCASFRDPGLVAQMATTLDEISAGRLILGVGAGWHDPEYEAFGLPTDHRVGRFAEWLEILARLVRGETVSYDGKYHQVNEAFLTPAPDRQIPILVAALRPRMLELTAKWADSWNTAWFAEPNEKVDQRLADMRAALETAGRTDEVSLTVGITVRDTSQPAIAEPEGNAIEGTPAELAEVIKAYESRGVTHLIAGLEPNTPETIAHLAEAKKLAAG